MRLYEIAASIRSLIESLDDGEIGDEQIAELERMQLAGDAKVDGICAVIRELEADCAARHAEIDRLRAGIQSREGSVSRLKAYMIDCLRLAGQRKSETGLFTVWRQKSPDRFVCMVPPDTLASQYQRVRIEPDLLAVKAAFEETGQVAEGFERETDREHLRIK